MAITTTRARRSHAMVELLSAGFIGCIGAAAIAAAILASNGGDHPRVGLSTTGGPKTVFSSEVTAPQTLLYLVGSHEKADQIAVAEHEWLLSFLDNNVTPPSRTYSIIVATTPEDVTQARQLAKLASEELMALGLPFEFVDLGGE